MEQALQENREARAFRCALLDCALCNLPVNIVVNERNGVYHIRDNTQMIIWADDLPSEGGKELLHDLANMIKESERSMFLNTFLQEIDIVAFRMRRFFPQAFMLKESEKREENRVLFDLNMGKDGARQVYEIRIET